jgi:hypothetical protein
VAELDQVVAWSAFVGLVLVARLLVSRRALRFLGPRISRLADWWVARQRPVSALDQEVDELSTVLRRQQLIADVERLRRIVATDESMSATRQIANRIAYRRLLYDLEKTPDVLHGMYDDSAGRWSPSVTTIPPSWYDSRRAPTTEVLEIGWRR